MGKPYSTEKNDNYGQVVEKHYDGNGKHSITDVWEKNSAGCTIKEGHSTVVDGERYDHYGSHTGSAGGKK